MATWCVLFPPALSRRILSFDCSPCGCRGRDSSHELLHVLLRYSIDVDTIPVTIEEIGDVLCVAVQASAGRETRLIYTWQKMKEAYTAHDLSLARMNSDTVRNGIP